MHKQFLSFALLIFSPYILASNPVHLYQAPISNLSKFKIIDKFKNSKTLQTIAGAEPNALQAINRTHLGNNSIVRYQQFYKGIPIVGAQVTVAKGKTSLSSNANGEVNGHVVLEMQININPAVSKQDALATAKKTYLEQYPQTSITAETSQLQIRSDSNDEYSLSYLVSFKTIKSNGKPAWPFFVINAQTGLVTTQWNNINNYLDTGPGGNEKVHEYWYGKDGLPALDVQQDGAMCLMESEHVRLVNLNSQWDWESKSLDPHNYSCGSNVEENVNGAFSPANDAYYFGHTIVEMYKKWYGLNALQHEDGSPMKLIMRVHFGEAYDNAFWDGETMTFGDGKVLYPLVSLDIAGHEVTHGFTQQHSNLEYHDESGAINESLSDMAGQAARAYLLETSNDLYNKSHVVPNKVTWGIGESVMRGQFGTAIRYMDQPSADGDSADCLDRTLARRNKASCAITFYQLLSNANQIDDPDERQGYIVHTASGIFNKAFYLISQKIGIKKTYQAMALANVKYWNATTGFKLGACGVIYAAKDLKIDLNIVHTAFGQVGIDTHVCRN
ncbi:MAG: peptidase M4 family protein [Tatlockia sp.]|nr:peptidase M4 family protein [Tatlockia sp.]